MVRNKRAAPPAPAAPPPAPAPAPLVQTVPWGADRRKPRAPPLPTVRMPASSVEPPVKGVTPPPPGQSSTTRFCLGPYERRGGSGTAPDAADGGSIGMDSEGSSTDVGVCLDDSASDVSQESLVTSDSAVSSPSARRVGRLSPGAGSTDSAATAAVAGDKDVSASRSASRNVTVTSINSAPSQRETSSTQVISVNSKPAEETKTERSAIQVISTSPVPPKAVSVVALNAPEDSPQLDSAVSPSRSPSQVISVQSNVTQNVTKTNISSDNDPKPSQVVSVSSSTLQSSPSRQSTPSPTVSLGRRPSSLGSSTVYLSPGQPTDSNSSETLPLPENSPSSAPSSGPPSSPPASSAPASVSQGSTSTVFLSPSQPASETSPETPSRPVSIDERDCSPPPAPQSSKAPVQQTSTAPEPQSPEATAQQTPEVPAPQPPAAPTPQSFEAPAQQSPAGAATPQKASPKAKAPQPPRKPPAPLPPASSPVSPAPSASPGASPTSPAPRQSPTLGQLQAPAPAPAPAPSPPAAVIQTRTYAERQRVPRAVPMPPLPEHGYQFHLREAAPEGEQGVTADGFAGVRDYLSPTAPIHSCRGTVRGVKDRVRAGIATFLQDNNTAKTLKSREQGRLVVYVTSLSIIRRTFQQCQRVRQVLRQLMAEFEERDLFLSCDHQQELQRRLGAERVTPPQLFIDGNLLGGAEAVERLNESGELRRMLKPFKVAGPRSSCGRCGGFRMLPCTSCNGSKKSCHRNHFTEQWVVLRCGACDQSGLMRCDLCSRS